jgi:hypothetical protein
VNFLYSVYLTLVLSACSDPCAEPEPRAAAVAYEWVSTGAPGRMVFFDVGRLSIVYGLRSASGSRDTLSPYHMEVCEYASTFCVFEADDGLPIVIPRQLADSNRELAKDGFFLKERNIKGSNCSQFRIEFIKYSAIYKSYVYCELIGITEIRYHKVNGVVETLTLRSQIGMAASAYELQ